MAGFDVHIRERVKLLGYNSLQRHLFILGYCRTMAMQHGGLNVRGPAPHVDIKGLNYEETTILISMGSYTH